MEYCNSIDRLFRIHAAATRAIQDALLKKGVSGLEVWDFALLEQLHAKDTPQTVTTLVRALSRPKPSITKATNRLEKVGFIFKHRNADDGRSTLCGLTPEGLKALEIFHDIHREIMKKLFKGVSLKHCNYMQISERMEKNLK